MVRKVGFGDDKAEPKSAPKTTVADRAMERFRKRARIKAAREANQKKSGRTKLSRILFLCFWLVLWVAMSSAVLYTMASEGLNTNVVPLVIWTGASVFVVSKVLTSIIKTIREDGSGSDRPENF
jgi:hypothetical protein